MNGSTKKLPRARTHEISSAGSVGTQNARSIGKIEKAKRFWWAAFPARRPVGPAVRPDRQRRKAVYCKNASTERRRGPGCNSIGQPDAGGIDRTPVTGAFISPKC